jgi:predicted permease
MNTRSGKKDILTLTAGLGLLAALLMNASAAAAACRDALGVCARMLIPSLFPFFVLSGFLNRVGLPGLLGSTVSTLGNMMGPVYMFTIGMILGNADLKAVFTNARVWFITFGRLVVYPAAAVLVLCFCGVFRLHPQSREIITVVALTAGAPAAVMVTQFTQMYRTEGEAQFASAVNIMTSVLCLATMPLISWLYQTLAY